MAEYIEREKAKGCVKEHYDGAIIIALDKIPAADVVEVVRCRDCAKREICRTSNTWAVAPSDDWFCADGERKGGAEDADS